MSQGHNDMLTAVGFEPVLPWSQHQRISPLRHSLPVIMHFQYYEFWNYNYAVQWVGNEEL